MSKIFAALFILSACALAYSKIGMPPVIIVGGSGVIGFFLWIKTYREGAVPARVILPPFLVTVAGLEAHMMEEYFTHFGPAMSRLFNITWSESSFLVVFAFVGPILYSLTALGFFYEKKMAGFLAWFIFIGPGVAEFTHFIFPFLRPALDPTNPAPITHTFASGLTMGALPNYYLNTNGHFYFPGLYTAILPMIPGIFGIVSVLRWKAQKTRFVTNTADKSGRKQIS